MFFLAVVDADFDVDDRDEDRLGAMVIEVQCDEGRWRVGARLKDERFRIELTSACSPLRPLPIFLSLREILLS